MTETTPVSGPPDDRAWQAHQGPAAVLRVTLFTLPIVFGALAIVLLGRWFVAGDGATGIAAWFVQATLVGGTVASGVDRATRRLLPLATLLGLSLTFPGPAPSRVAIGLRANNTDTTGLVERGLSNDPAVAAVEAIELVTAVATHRRLTPGATEQLHLLADATAVELGVNEADRTRLAWAVLLHDIGELTTTEPESLESHTTTGESFIAPLADWLGSWRYATSQHHERWDGNGYPKGIGGERITLAGRIVAVVGAFRSFTSEENRPSSAGTPDAELLALSGTHFDPSVVKALLDVAPATQASGLAAVMPTIALPGVAIHAAQAAAVVIGAGGLAMTVHASTEPLALDAAAPVVSNETPATTSSPITAPMVTTWQAEADTTAPRQALRTELTAALEPTSSSSAEPETTTTEQTTTSTTVATSSTTAGPTTAVSTTAVSTTVVTTAAPTTSYNAPEVTTTVEATTTTLAGPTAMPDNVDARSARNKRINVLANDIVGPSGSSLDIDSLSILDQPEDGLIEIKNGGLWYRSDDGFVGEDSFVYQICNELGACSSAKVSITVR